MLKAVPPSLAARMVDWHTGTAHTLTHSVSATAPSVAGRETLSASQASYMEYVIADRDCVDNLSYNSPAEDI